MGAYFYYFRPNIMLCYILVTKKTSVLQDFCALSYYESKISVLKVRAFKVFNILTYIRIIYFIFITLN